MADCKSCPSQGHCDKQEVCVIEHNPNNKIRNVIGVMSGKGGVGKSTITVMMAKKLKELGYRVGILDADITGPSIPRLLGLSHKRAAQSGKQLLPVETDDGIKAMSINFILEDENQPVVWRGPIVSQAVKQFWVDVLWGELDYLLVDLPPGTSDVSLTVMQNIPVDGSILVSLPQDFVSMIVKKALHMNTMLGIHVLGIVENMSYIECPSCQDPIYLYDQDATLRFTEEAQLDKLASFPMTKAIVNLHQSGIESLGSASNQALSELTEKTLDKLTSIKGDFYVTA